MFNNLMTGLMAVAEAQRMIFEPRVTHISVTNPEVEMLMAEKRQAQRPGRVAQALSRLGFTA